jgi:anti-sigma regulatory factor (Ser/Thr protein kinase)
MTTNLVEGPVDGSMVHSRLPVTPQPSAAWLRQVEVSKSAPEQARYEAGWFLRRCRAATANLIEDAVLVISELVTNAYKAMDGQVPAGTIEFSIRLFDDHLLLEVIDRSDKVPVYKGPVDAGMEDGRGLCIVETISDDWGYFFHRGRKVVYAILLLDPEAA